MGAIQVKNVPEDLHDELRRRADREGMSISEYVLLLIRRDLRVPSTEEWFQMLKTAPRPSSLGDVDVVAEIAATRGARDRDRDELTRVPDRSAKERTRGQRRR